MHLIVTHKYILYVLQKNNIKEYVVCYKNK